MFSKILIANRGEIAVRVIRACKEMGIATVAIYSQADRDALHVALADESYCVGEANPADSYLNEERVISAALVSGAQAIHPGYGFLSENAHFAALCRKNGLVFVGPTPESMEQLSDKAQLKQIMGDNGLEVIPGTQVLSSAQEALAAGANIGYPVMLKASAGGGGRGIRLVRWPRPMPWPWPRGSPPSGTARCTWRSTSTPPGTLRSRCWPTRPAMWSAWGSGTAPSSGTTRNSLRNPPPRR